MMNDLTLGSLFDGSGGFPLGGLLCGITPLWASEIEPFPIRVTTKWLPNMEHLGDISKLNGAEIQHVDIISFGSPCQDMSVAGKRVGLKGSHSNLFYEAIRIIREMREKTNGKYPRYIVWENVTGAFSSNKGQDFKSVLESIINIKEPSAKVPMPKKSKWPYADVIVGDGFSIAYRTLDAQYWGVPQRRKRIYLVTDFNGQSAWKILFKSEGLSRYPPKSLCPWKRTADNAENCVNTTGIGIDGYNSSMSELAATLGVNCGISTGRNGVMVLNDQGGQRMEVTKEMTSTLRAKANHPPLVFENHSQDCRYTGPQDTSQTVLATFGTGGNNQPFVLETPKTYGICSKDSNSMKSSNPHSGFYEADTSRTLDANGGNPSCNQGGIAVVALQGSMIGRADNNGPQGNAINKNVSFTLNTTDHHAVVYAIDRESYNCGQNYARKMGISEDGINSTLNAQGPSAVAAPVYSSSKASFFTYAEKELANTLVATDYKDPPLVNDNDGAKYIVRRLTPTECGRLQGFPDWWCSNLDIQQPTKEDIKYWQQVFDAYRIANGSKIKPKSEKQIIKWLKNPHSDSAEYKMWGNGVALPCVFFVLAGIKYFYDEENEIFMKEDHTT